MLEFVDITYGDLEEILSSNQPEERLSVLSDKEIQSRVYHPKTVEIYHTLTLNATCVSFISPGTDQSSDYMLDAILTELDNGKPTLYLFLNPLSPGTKKSVLVIKNAHVAETKISRNAIPWFPSCMLKLTFTAGLVGSNHTAVKATDERSVYTSSEFRLFFTEVLTAHHKFPDDPTDSIVESVAEKPQPSQPVSLLTRFKTCFVNLALYSPARLGAL
jgi:hypothetical protein